MKTYKFNLTPIFIQAENESEAWKKYEEGNDWVTDCNDMEELE